MTTWLTLSFFKCPITCNQSVNQSGSLWSRETAHGPWVQSIKNAYWGECYLIVVNVQDVTSKQQICTLAEAMDPYIWQHCLGVHQVLTSAITKQCN